MAGFFRRRRGLLLKMLLAIPILYILSLFVFSADSNRMLPPIDNHGKGVVDKRDRNVLFERVLQNIQLKEQTQPKDDHVDWKPKDEGQQRQLRDVNIDQTIHKEVQVTTLRMEHKNRPNLQDLQAVVKPTPDLNAPGGNGKGVVIDKDKLSEDDKKKFEEGWKNNAYNQFASDMMSLHRSLPDVRDKECQSHVYHANLPDTSVVICFHNEAWSVLLRTVHSVIDRTPPHLLKEIILVDDFSDMDHLKKPLQDYIAKLEKVKITRTKEREGLIRARLAGFSVATAEVVTFLDSHCECSEGWIEPLLDRIALNQTNVVCPVIDVIDDDTLKYQYGNAKSTSIGGFDWNMQFSWHAIPDYERKRRTSDTMPIKSPTMAGGLFAISRTYFEKLGTYDPGMDIWGGENLELSFRVWMCGGTLEIIPCSHVGHIFRKRSPYKWRTGVNVVKKNTIRLAEVWMDEYKTYYYERFNFDLNTSTLGICLPMDIAFCTAWDVSCYDNDMYIVCVPKDVDESQTGDYGDIAARKELRKSLGCKSFAWYIKNVYPDLFVPGEAKATGEIRSKARPMCIDSPSDHRNYHKPVNMWPCHNQGGNQFWMLSKQGEIRRDDGCLDYSVGENAIIYPCHGQKGNQEWKYTEDNAIHHINTQKCAEVSVDGKNLTMKKCSGIDRQIWMWKRKATEGEILIKV